MEEFEGGANGWIGSINGLWVRAVSSCLERLNFDERMIMQFHKTRSNHLMVVYCEWNGARLVSQYIIVGESDGSRDACGQDASSRDPGV